MATNIQDPVINETPPTPLGNLLNRGLVFNWEIALYVLIFVLAIVTRFYDLGARTMSHDESLHTLFSYNLYNDGRYEHNPMMHGPVLFHATAFFYYLFGDSDFSARLYTAILGVLLVMYPLLFRHWLGRWGALLACVMMLASPLLMYYNRYIREDTPSIFYSLTMVYCTLMYLSGPTSQRGKSYWLYIFAGAMLLSLASKESAFIYIAIFGIFLAIYWFVRLAQHYLKIDGKLWLYVIMISVFLAGVASLGMYIILDIVPLERVLAAVAPDPTQTSPAASPVEVNAFFTWTGLVFVSVFGVCVATMIWAFRARDITFGWVDAAAMGVVALSFVACASYQLWLIGFVLALIMGFGYAFLRLRPERAPWLALFAVLVLSVAVCAVLIIAEERSHVSAETGAVQQAVPGQQDQVVGQPARVLIFYAMYGVAAVVVVGAFFLSQTGVWAQFKRFPEFDLLILMGTLILPWSTPILVKLMGANTYNLQDIARVVAAALPFQGFEISTYGTQVLLAFLTMIPTLTVAIVIGLLWDARRWLIASAVFHILFVFFFTTVFTNIQGIGTGMFGSLGYWLEQQAVRRGSQPQYYYLIVVMPFYEFLPILGSIAGMFAGLTVFWRYLRAQQERRDVFAFAAADEEKLKNETAVLIDGELPPDQVEVERPVGQPARGHALVDQLQQVPFLLFVSWWAIFNLIGYTLAGEKMPWLGTHMTVPMIFIAAWCFGDLFSKIEWSKFLKGGWIYALLLPLLGVILFQLVFAFWTTQRPFSGDMQNQLQRTFQWLGLLAVGGVAGYFVWQATRQTGWRHLRVMIGAMAFVALLVITLRSALMASFIYHDTALEFLVYAHGGPANKEVTEQMAELSERAYGDMSIPFAYDNMMAWPGSWYFRHFSNARFFGSTPTLQQLEDAVFVLVGDENLARVEPLLADRYIRFRRIRMWWPMQDYFNLSAERLLNLFDMTNTPQGQQAAQVRQGIFDIWWSRDYTTYDRAADGDTDDFTLAEWPVNNFMYVYVRRDFAQQVWNLGAGEGTVGVGAEETQVSQCVANWQNRQSELAFGETGAGLGQLNRPLQPAIGPDGNLYLPEESNHRISVFSPDGSFVRVIGQQGDATTNGAYFTRPNSVAFGPDGSMYVADTWNFRIMRLAPDGTLLNVWGQRGEFGLEAPVAPQDAFWGPRTVAVDAQGNVYVADTGNKRVRVYAADGTWLRDIGAGGSGDGQLDEPVGLAIDNVNGELYVAEWWNRRISVFSLDGQFLRKWDVFAWYDEFGNRAYVALDQPRGLVYVTDPDLGRVLVYDRQGNCVGAFGQSNKETINDFSFNVIGGLVVDAQGNVYITDAVNGRVLRFPPFTELSMPTAEATPEVVETTIEAALPTAEATIEATEQSEPSAIATPEPTSEVTTEPTGELTPGG